MDKNAPRLRIGPHPYHDKGVEHLRPIMENMARNAALMVCLLFAFVPTPALAQAVTDPQDVLVKLERTSCFGECPVYSVTIDGRGNVTYDGEQFVRVKGRATGRISVSRVLPFSRPPSASTFSG
jgi:Domain of unknown function (DUF6438)